MYSNFMYWIKRSINSNHLIIQFKPYISTYQYNCKVVRNIKEMLSSTGSINLACIYNLLKIISLGYVSCESNNNWSWLSKTNVKPMAWKISWMMKRNNRVPMGHGKSSYQGCHVSYPLFVTISFLTSHSWAKLDFVLS